jgi:acyl-CoA hydrolase/GNAT superfamily N-acetyltransferase
MKSYWPDEYLKKKTSAREAIASINVGQRVFIGTACGEPQHLVKELADQADNFTDLEIIRLQSLETAPLSLASESRRHNFTIRSFYSGSTMSEAIARTRRFSIPINLSTVPHLFRTHQVPIHVALVQVSPPDDFGWMSMGISVDITFAAALSAQRLIVQVNPRMPRVLGHSFLHVDDADMIVEFEEELIAIPQPPRAEEIARTIARHVSKLIEDGSTIQLGIGELPQAAVEALSEKKDLGIHTQVLTDGAMELVSRGVVTNRHKGMNEGKIVASYAIGSKNLYEFLHDNPSIEFHPSDYVINPLVIAGHNRMVSLNTASYMDLTGQVAADAKPENYFSGVTGMLDFIRGAAMAQHGKSILIIPSTSQDGKSSRIVPILEENTAVVVPRGDVYYVVSEYGVVNLYGKSLEDRAIGMISLAHPDFRDELFSKAQQLGLIGKDRTLKESVHAVYPLKYEERMRLDDVEVMIRPIKSVDERRLQEHFYNLDKTDIVSRFFHKKTTFVRDDVAMMYEIDYVKEMTIVAVIGEFGFGRVIAVGGYILEQDRNMAEVAFSVSKDWQRKGLSKIIMRKLAEAAHDNGIAGLVAYTSPNNRSMIGLFNSLPYEVKTVYEQDMLVMRCRFDQLKAPTA